MKWHSNRSVMVSVVLLVLGIAGPSLAYHQHSRNSGGTQLPRTVSGAAHDEKATIVLMSSEGVWHIGAQWKTAIEANGMKVAKTVNSSGWQSSTMIFDNSQGKKTATLKALESLFGPVRAESTALDKTYPDAQFIVVIGRDQPAPKR